MWRHYNFPRRGFERMRNALAACFLVCLTSPVFAQVSEASPNHFLIERTVQINATPMELWDQFVRIGEWWHPDHTHTGDSSRLSLDPTPGGCFCEALASGGFAVHMNLGHVDPGIAVRMLGGLGPLQEYPVSGAMTWEFNFNDDGTALTLRYRVYGMVDGGLDGWAEAVDGVLAQQLERLQARFIDS